MKIFKTQEEINQALNSDGNLIINGPVTFECSFEIAGNINAWDITARDISAWDITARDITAGDITAGDITARDITAGNISAWNITAGEIWTAGDITAGDITAGDISYYAVCFSYQSFKCRSIKGRRNNSKHFCLDSEIKIIKE